jgi:hypothetical protein
MKKKNFMSSSTEKKFEKLYDTIKNLKQQINDLLNLFEYKYSINFFYQHNL